MFSHVSKKSNNSSPLSSHNSRGGQDVLPTSDHSGGASDVFTSTPAIPIFDDHRPEVRDRSEGLEEYNKVAESE